MVWIWSMPSPLGEILLASADGHDLCGAWFCDQRYFAAGLEEERRTAKLPLFETAEVWLDHFFRGEDPGPFPLLAPRGTLFQQRVWSAMARIPYGATRSYGELASLLDSTEGGKRTSPRAVGSAVSRNPISVFLPCHRVMGADGSLHGYAGGLWRKAALLAMEQGIPFAE